MRSIHEQKKNNRLVSKRPEAFVFLSLFPTRLRQAGVGSGVYLAAFRDG
jgi:hypothetical protein